MEKEHRELYRQKYQAQMDEWSARVAEMRAHDESLTPQARVEAQPAMDTVHRKYEAAKARLHEIAGTTDEKWEEVKRAADDAWSDFKSTVEGAYETLKSKAQGHTSTAAQPSPAEPPAPQK